MPNPTTYASAKQFVGLAKEATQGTAVLPTWTMPVEEFAPKDVPVWLDDKAMRGSMGEPYGKQQGPLKTEFQLKGPWFGDTGTFLLSNILGDLVDAGTYTGSGTTTLSSGVSAGATSIQTAASIANGTIIQIDTGALSEIVTTSGAPTGSGPYTIPVPALRYGHLSNATVQPVQAPYTHAAALLNSGSAQPGSLTFTDYQGPTASVAARAYSGCCLSELTLKGNAESTLIEMDAKGTGWPSAPAAQTPTSSPSAAQPLAAWRFQLGIAGPATGGTLVKTVSEFEIAIKRDLQVIWTGQNSQNPYIIQRGKVTATGKLVFAAVADETPLGYLLNNTQPQVQLVISNGQSGANAIALQVDVGQAAFTAMDINRGKSAVGYDGTFECILNTTNAGASGGYSPLKLTATNAVSNTGGLTF